MTMKRMLRVLAVLGTVLLASGCALKAPNYVPSIDNVGLIKGGGASMAVGSFTVQAGVAPAISLRSNPMSSPVGADYAAYLAEAIRQELGLAGKLDPASKIEISGVVTKNDIAAGGISTNSGEIEARIVVRNGGAVRFDKLKRADMSWESSFVGAIAIPKAQQNYPLIVQRLLGAIWSDPDFQKALQ
jgi:hypothetical protein